MGAVNGRLRGRLVCIMLLLVMGMSPAAARSDPQLAPEFSARLSGPRLDWYFPPRLRGSVEGLSDLAERQWQEMTVELGGPLGRATVVVALDNAQMRRAVAEAADLPDWAAGATLPRLGLVLVAVFTPGGREPEEVLAHELAHLALYRRLGRLRVPRWFHEGYAQFRSDEWSFERARTLAWAVVGGKLLSLAALSDTFPRRAAEARLAYAQSVDFVSYLIDRFGRARFADLVRRLVSGSSLSLALEDTYDIGVEQLEQQWFASLRRRFTWVPLLTGTAAVWTLALVALLLAYRRRRRQRRLRLEQMEAEERLEPPPPPGDA